MTAETALSSQEFERALAVLQREQHAHMPSARQVFLFRTFNWVVFSFILFSVLAFVLPFIADSFETEDTFPLIIGIFALLWFSLSILVVLLFFLNLGFMLKLVEQSRLRRKFNIEKRLKKAFNRRTRLLNIILFIVLMCIWG
jgi:hypothetical protein